MEGRVISPDMTLTLGALSAVMPMHLCVDGQGRITAVGPTLAKLFPHTPLIGQDLFAIFTLRRTGPLRDMTAVMARMGQLLTLTPRQGDIALRGIAVPLAGGQGLLLNLSFGSAVVEAVRHFALTNADFAPTDLTMELLYLVEANAAVRSELSALNTRLEGARSAAEEQALTDTLTGLRNRRAMDAALHRMLAAGLPFALVHLDLDFFKRVNDTRGHAAGDHVLIAAAQTLRQATRAGDTVARVGGDEFVILLPAQTEPLRLQAIADRIIARLQVPILFEGQMCRISGSIGITTTLHYAQPSAEAMMADADMALYASKHAGRGRATLWGPQLAATADG